MEWADGGSNGFLSYYPLKQGLKLPITGIGNMQEIYFYPTIH